MNQIWKIIIKNEINLFFWRHFLKFSLERFRTVYTLNLSSTLIDWNYYGAKYMV